MFPKYCLVLRGSWWSLVPTHGRSDTSSWMGLGSSETEWSWPSLGQAPGLVFNQGAGEIQGAPAAAYCQGYGNAQAHRWSVCWRWILPSKCSGHCQRWSLLFWSNSSWNREGSGSPSLGGLPVSDISWLTMGILADWWHSVWLFALPWSCSFAQISINTQICNF